MGNILSPLMKNLPNIVLNEARAEKIAKIIAVQNKIKLTILDG
jgi:hypothetical protein